MGDRVPVGYDQDRALGHVESDVMIDHATVVRVIRRATEMAGPEHHGDSVAGVSRDALVAAALEVGLPAIVVLRSIATERLGPPPAKRATDRLFGAAVVSVDGEIPGAPDDVLQRIDAWLVDGHHLRRDRIRNGRGEWSKRSGVVGVTVRRVRTATGEGRLGEFRQVTASAADIGTGSAAVRVMVDRSSSRRVAVAGGAAAAAVGSVGGLVAAVAMGPVALVAAPFVVMGTVAAACAGTARARRTATEVERMLEAVADHRAPVRLRTDVARRLTGRRDPGRFAASLDE